METPQVKNEPASLPAPYRIAIVGEAPGRDEESAKRPFVGASGRFLMSLLQTVGIRREACYVGNVSMRRPPGNEFSTFAWNGEEVTEGFDVLRAELAAFKPNLVLLLGNVPLHAAKCGTVAPKRRGPKFVFPHSVSDWRGSLFVCNETTSPFFGYKCLATYHPAAVLRLYDWAPVMKFDLKRAAVEGMFPGLTLPTRLAFVDDITVEKVVNSLQRLRDEKLPVTLDIEGYVADISCVSFAQSSSAAFIVPFKGGADGNYWPSVEDEMRVWKAVAEFLEDPEVPKVLQNSLYDAFVFAYSYGIVIQGLKDDTMLKHWEKFSELEKSLGFQASVYTKEPYYKNERKVNDLRVHWTYCCKDSMVTHEINEFLEQHMTTDEKRHYQFNLDMLNPILYMEMRGIRYDFEKARLRREGLLLEKTQWQAKLDELAGRPLNVRSTKFTSYLYDELGLPEQLNRTTGARTGNYEALLKLAKKTAHPVCHLAIRLRSLGTREQMLRIYPDSDGRIRCGYNVVGTPSGRLACYTSPTGSGYNLQTIPEYDRDLFVADDGYDLFQCDLVGADGWTVAAHCASLGDRTMLDDLLAGVKIAKVIACMFEHGPQISNLPRQELLALTKTIPKDSQIYFGSKCCQHGTNYGMGHVLLSATIFIQSEGKVNIPSADAKHLQDLYLRRYPGVARWHQWVWGQIKNKGYLVSAAGHRRVLFGRRDDHATFKAALANEPQENTTYATNQAALHLWSDPENRRGGKLIVEPLHQVHDALVGQWRKEDRDFAVAKLYKWFLNPLVIANQQITIPFEGRYGRSWGELTEAF